MDVYCLDIGTHSVKVSVFLESGTIEICNDLKIHSSVDVQIGNKDDAKMITNKEFIPMINMSLKAVQETAINASNITTDKDNYLKTKDSDLYMEELLALLLERVISKNRNQHLIHRIAINLPQSETLNCAAILTGLKHQRIPEYKAIIAAYLHKCKCKEKRVLAVDLKYSCFKVYMLNIDDKKIDAMKTYPFSSNEFTLALFNYVVDECGVNEVADLLKECEAAKIALSQNDYVTVNGFNITRRDFEKCIRPIVQRLICKLREFLNGALKWNGDVVLLGGSFAIPSVLSRFRDALKGANFVDLDVGFENVVAYGMALYQKNRS